MTSRLCSAGRRFPRLLRRARRSGRTLLRPNAEWLELRSLLSTSNSLLGVSVDLPTDPMVQEAGRLTKPSAYDQYSFTLDAEGRLQAYVHGQGVNTLLSLVDSQGRVLLQSQALSPTNLDDHIDQHLPAGTYHLVVSSLSGAGAYQLYVGFEQATAPLEPLSGGSGSMSVTLADLNGDRIADVVVPDYYNNQVLINYGTGDGTFRPPVGIPVDAGPIRAVAADFNQDGRLDLAVANQLADDVSVLLGQPDGSLALAASVATSASPTSLVAADLDRDGRVDLAVADQTDDCVEIFHNNGNVTFTRVSQFGSLAGPTALAAADFNGDGRLDLAVASSAGKSVFLLAGFGNGVFVLQQVMAVGPGCRAVASGDFNGDGRPDLAAVSTENNTVSVFINSGGWFGWAPTVLSAGRSPYDVISGDFDGDGRTDLATCNFGSNNLSLFRGLGDGTFQPAISLSTGAGPMGLATADLTGEGRLDLVTSDFDGLSATVLLNNGDGTFQDMDHSLSPATASNVRTADLNHDGIVDLVVTEQGYSDVAVLLGRGDGTFRDPTRYAVGAGPFDAVIADLNQDGIPDIATSNYFACTVSVLLGQGNGTFKPFGSLPAGEGATSVKAVDLNGDSRLDLVSANYISNDISLFYGMGGGQFTNPVEIAVGHGPSAVDFADFNGDGLTDLAVSNVSSSDVTVLLGTGAGRFAPAASFAAGVLPWWIIARDLNGDGHPDIVVVNGVFGEPSNVSVLLGTGYGTFRAPITAATGIGSYPMTIGDFNGDGRPDLVVGNDNSNDLSLLLGRGDGTFLPEVRIPSGTQPYGLAVADFNRDGRLDVVSANYQSSDLTIDLNMGKAGFSSTTLALAGARLPMISADFNNDSLPDIAIAEPATGTITIRTSEGDGTFETVCSISIGGPPAALAVGDFNGDGRPDLAVANASSGQILIFYGLGDGTFQEGPAFQACKTPSALVAGDFNSDGIPDLAVADRELNAVTVFLGQPTGTFRPQAPVAVGLEPVALAAADLNGDGRTDLVAANQSSGSLTFLWNTGTAFVHTDWRGTPISPSAVIATDFDGDGITDIGVADQAGNRVLLFMGQGHGLFAPPVAHAVGQQPSALAAADLDALGTGRHDLVVADAGSSDLTIFRGIGKASVNDTQTIALDGPPGGLIVAILKGDTHADLSVANASTGDIDVYLGGGNGAFTSPQSTIPLPTPSAFLTLVNGLTEPFLLSITDQGEALVRYGVPGVPGEFDSPIDVTAGTGISVADAVVLASPIGMEISALDSHLPMIWVEKPAGQTFTLLPIALPDGGIYTRLVGGDLNSDGRDDLMVIDRGSDRVLTFCQDADGDFYPYGQSIQVGFGPTDVALADVHHNGLPELVVANGSSGDVSIIPRGPDGSFGGEIRLRSGPCPAGTVSLPDGLHRSNGAEPVGVVTGVFDASGLTDIVVLNRGADRISILKGTSGGGFADPNLATSYSTGLAPTHLIAAPLTRNGRLDLAVLNRGSRDISVYLNDGRGGFMTMPRVSAGDDPSGLTVYDVNQDGAPDLVVNNEDGDVLVLLGNGDGTFRPYQRTDRSVNLAVGDLTGSGKADFVLSNAAQDELSVLFTESSNTFSQGRDNGLRAPGPVAIADMNSDGIQDLILTNRGANEVFIYLGIGGGRFAAPQEFYTGTSPAGLTIADLDSDGSPDLLVANSGSNDVSVLLGQYTATGWSMRPGPRLEVGSRPVATAVGEFDTDGAAEIISVNQRSNSVTVIRGVGNGFFADQSAETLQTGAAPIQAFAGRFSASSPAQLIVLNSQSDAMTYYSTLEPNSAASIPLHGQNPIAGVMADLNHDGYSDLIIANAGDPRLNVFLGGVHGPVFGGYITLAHGELPTNLAISNVGGKGLELFVSTGSDNHVVPVSLTAALIGSPAAASGASAPAAGAGGAFLPGGLTLTSALENGLEFNGGAAAQVEASATAVAASVSSAAGSAASASIAAVSQSIQPQIFAAFRSLSWLLDNLGPKEHGQISDILPMAQNELAAVAVILAVPNLLDSNNTEGEAILPGQNAGSAGPIETALGMENLEPAARLSSVDRFLANLDPTLAQVARGSLEGPERRTGWAAEWVWRQSSALPLRGEDIFHQAVAASLAERESLATAAEIRIESAEPVPAQLSPRTQPSAATQRVRISLAAIIVVTLVVLWHKFGERIRQMLRRNPQRLEPNKVPVPALWSLHEDRQELLRSRSMRDLPPWLRNGHAGSKSRSRV